MLRLYSLLALVALSFVSVQAAVDADLVTSVPGFTGTLKNKHYSGFLPSDDAETVFLHYWFVESAGKTSDPVVLWLNGGPGCSSLDGLLSELGPLHFSGKDSSTPGLPEVIDNPYAWSSVANVIFLESPAGVGFSYTKNGSTATNDEITSQNNYGFLKSFFKAYPEYSTNPFWITGESYAGIYTPTLAVRIIEGKQAGDNTINLKGLAAGNGCIGNAIGTCAMYDGGWEGTGISMNFLYNHAMISYPHWDAIQSSCGNFSDPNPSIACIRAVNAAGDDGGDYNIYSIYDQCDNSLGMTEERPLRLETGYTKFLQSQGRPLPSSKVNSPQALDVCLGSQPAAWLNNADVQKALHVDAQSARWSICANIEYRKTLGNALPAYKMVVDSGYQVLIYSGDVDACVPHVGTEAWTSTLGYKEITPWQPWTINDQVAGYVTYYEKNFTYLTVKGAGHMVPQYRPVEALTMLQRFMAGGKFTEDQESVAVAGVFPPQTEEPRREKPSAGVFPPQREEPRREKPSAGVFPPQSEEPHRVRPSVARSTVASA